MIRYVKELFYLMFWICPRKKCFPLEDSGKIIKKKKEKERKNKEKNIKL